MRSEMGIGDYLWYALTPERLTTLSNRAVNALTEKGWDFGSIAYTGNSGGLMAPIICEKMGKHPLLVRKPDENSHAVYDIEGRNLNKDFIIVDDFIAEGETVRTMLERIYALGFKGRCKGILLYLATPTKKFHYVAGERIPVLGIWGRRYGGV